MVKQFYEKALPKSGVYCVAELDRSKPSDKQLRHHFAESLDEVIAITEKLKATNKLDVYVAMGTFSGYTRSAKSCVYHKSFFIDLDVGEDKGYQSKADALAALDKFIVDVDLPPPFKVDSGVGIHAYWVFDEDIPAEEFLPYATLFKKLCLEHLKADPVATPADLARIMRWVSSTNYKPTPPAVVTVLDDTLIEYSFDAFKEFLGEPEEPQKAVLAAVPKGLDEDTKAILKLDNFKRTFQHLAEKSLTTEDGCAQIKNILMNSATLVEPLWWAGLSIAKFCDDGPEAIHLMSEDYPNYSYEDTEQKASRISAPKTCSWFINNHPEHCDKCPHRGTITTPIVLARELKTSAEFTIASDSEDPIRKDANPEEIFTLPDFMTNFRRGEKGGIYYIPPPTTDKRGQKKQDPPVLLIPYDLYAIRRIYSKHDGECLVLRIVLPKDPLREVLMPMKTVYSVETFKGFMSSNGVFVATHHVPYLMEYIIKWGQYLQSKNKAENMRMQMGWTADPHDTDEWGKRSFVVGNVEIDQNGQESETPSSPFVRGISKLMHKAGTYKAWRESADFLNTPGFEIQAMAMLCGFASPLMSYTSTSGISICLLGQSGGAKTGAMYAGLSAFGHPKDLSVMESTENGLTGRYLGLHNLLFGLDEISNKDPKLLSQLIHKVSHGKTKIRMQASVNAEREHEMSASLICLMTTNQSAITKLESFKVNPDGEAARLIEFLVSEQDILKDSEGAKLGKRVFDAFNYNYGHAGPMFIKEVFKLGDSAMRSLIEKWYARILKDFGGGAPYRFHHNFMSVIGAAGELAAEKDIITLDIERVYHEVTAHLIMIRDKVVKINRSDYSALLGDYVNKHINNFLVIKNGAVTMEPRGSIVGRIVSDEGTMQISKTELKKYLSEAGISGREFEFEMKARGLLIDDKKGRLTTGWKSAIQVDPSYLYWFKTEVPDELINGAGSDN